MSMLSDRITVLARLDVYTFGSINLCYNKPNFTCDRCVF